MATRSMTFEIPEDVADLFECLVPAAEQSSVVAGLMRRQVSPHRLTEAEWDALCAIANADQETKTIQREMASLPNTMTEEWNDDSIQLSPSR